MSAQRVQQRFPLGGAMPDREQARVVSQESPRKAGLTDLDCDACATDEVVLERAVTDVSARGSRGSPAGRIGDAGAACTSAAPGATRERASPGSDRT